MSDDVAQLRIYIGERDTYRGKPLCHALVAEANRRGLAGATVIPGVGGFGAHRRIHGATLLRLSGNPPVIVEIVDTPARIEAFLPVVESMVPEGTVTVSTVTAVSRPTAHTR